LHIADYDLDDLWKRVGLPARDYFKIHVPLGFHVNLAVQNCVFLFPYLPCIANRLIQVEYVVLVYSTTSKL